MKKALMLFALIIALVSLSSVWADTDPLYEKPLVMGYLQDLASSNFYAIPAGTDNLTYKMVGGLPIIIDDVNGQYVPSLFESWEVSDDQLTWTFHIRQDAYWHDGVQVTADDVIFSEAYLKEMEEFENWHCWWQFDFPYQLIKVDDYTVQFVLETPTSAILANLGEQTGEIIPKHIWENIERKDFANCEEAKLPIGFGPYKMVDYKQGDSITLEANENYYDGAPKIKTVIIKIFASSASATLALESGDIDSLSLQANDYDRLVNQEQKIAGVQIQLIAEHEFGINHLREPLNDVRMRKALNYAMDNETVLASAYGGVGKVAYGIFVPEVMYSDTSVWTDYSYNIDKVHELLEDMGYTMGSDGYYQKDGKTLEFDAIYSSSNDTFANIAIIYQYTAKEAGIKLNIEGLDSAILSDRKNNKDYDLALGGWSLGIDNSIYNANNYYSDAVTENSQHLDELWKVGASSNDDEVRAAVYREIDQILSDDAVWVYIVQRGQCFGYDKDLDISEAVRDSGNDFLYYNKLAWKN